MSEMFFCRSMVFILSCFSSSIRLFFWGWYSICHSWASSFWSYSIMVTCRVVWISHSSSRALLGICTWGNGGGVVCWPCQWSIPCLSRAFSSCNTIFLYYRSRNGSTVFLGFQFGESCGTKILSAATTSVWSCPEPGEFADWAGGLVGSIACWFAFESKFHITAFAFTSPVVVWPWIEVDAITEFWRPCDVTAFSITSFCVVICWFYEGLDTEACPWISWAGLPNVAEL